MDQSRPGLQALDQEFLMNARNASRESEIRQSSDFRYRPVLRKVLDLSTARSAGQSGTADVPEIVSEPFDGFYIEDATDTLATVKLNFVSTELHQVTGYMSLKKNDSAYLGQVQRGAVLTNAAQSGKSITIVFFMGIRFTSGSLISQNAGGVSINDGSAFVTAAVALAAATATAVFASNSSRKVGHFENETGADLWVGGSSVSNAGANKGRVVHPGGVIEWRNTAALYAYSVAGGTVITMEES